jgi:hypothetical protein
MSEIYLWHKQSKKKNSVFEVSRLLFFIHDILVEHQAKNCMFLKAKSVIEEKSRESFDTVCDKFCTEVACLYESGIEYLQKWG